MTSGTQTSKERANSDALLCGNDIVKLPKGFLFPINPQGPIQLEVVTRDQEEYTLLVGGVGPLSGDTNRRYPGLCIRHLRLILRILLGKEFDSPEVPIKYVDLLTSCDGYKQRQNLNRTIDELAGAWVHQVSGGRATAARLVEFNTQVYYKAGVDGADVEHISSEANILRRNLKNVRFHEGFWRACLNWANVWQVRADVVGKIYSDLVAACYLLLTPRAYHPAISARTKGKKNAAELLREVGATVPKHLSDLRRTFERARGGLSVLEQLNGLPTADGYLCVDEELEPTSDGSGYLVRFWIMKESEHHEAGADFEKKRRTRGALLDYWVSLGLPEDEFERLQQDSWRGLEAYEIDRIQSLGYPVEPNRRYLELIRSFIGPAEFAVCIGSAHQAKEEGTMKEGPEKWFGGALRNAWRERVKYHAGRGR